MSDFGGGCRFFVDSLKMGCCDGFDCSSSHGQFLFANTKSIALFEVSIDYCNSRSGISEGDGGFNKVRGSFVRYDQCHGMQLDFSWEWMRFAPLFAALDALEQFRRDRDCRRLLCDIYRWIFEFCFESPFCCYFVFKELGVVGWYFVLKCIDHRSSNVHKWWCIAGARPTPPYKRDSWGLNALLHPLRMSGHVSPCARLTTILALWIFTIFAVSKLSDIRRTSSP
jgi:hypothetical protein